MKHIRIFGIVIAVILVLALTGCYRLTDTITMTLTEPPITITSTQTIILSNGQSFVPVLVNWSDNCSWIGQDKITLNDVSYGDTIDTWTQDINGVTGYLWEKGDPLCFTIYNNELTEEVYRISLDNVFYGQPIGYEKWVDIAEYHPIVPAQTAMNIPVKIQIPPKADTIIPEQWEFRINVVPDTTNTIQFETKVRFIINMK